MNGGIASYVHFIPAPQNLCSCASSFPHQGRSRFTAQRQFSGCNAYVLHNRSISQHANDSLPCQTGCDCQILNHMSISIQCSLVDFPCTANRYPLQGIVHIDICACRNRSGIIAPEEVDIRFQSGTQRLVRPVIDLIGKPGELFRIVNAVWAGFVSVS